MSNQGRRIKLQSLAILPRQNRGTNWRFTFLPRQSIKELPVSCIFLVVYVSLPKIDVALPGKKPENGCKITNFMRHKPNFTTTFFKVFSRKDNKSLFHKAITRKIIRRNCKNKRGSDGYWCLYYTICGVSAMRNSENRRDTSGEPSLGKRTRSTS